MNVGREAMVLVRSATLLSLGVCVIACRSTDAPSETNSIPVYTPASAVPFSDIENVHIAALHNEPNTYVFAFNKDTGDLGRGAVWGTLDPHGWVRIYAKGPAVSLFQIYYMSISENDKYLAVGSAGEGHPAIDVFELQKWLNFAPRGMDEDEPPLEPVATLNAYPFSPRALGWRGNSLILESSGPLDELEVLRSSGKHADLDALIDSPVIHTFIWDVENDRLQRDE